MLTFISRKEQSIEGKKKEKVFGRYTAPLSRLTIGLTFVLKFCHKELRWKVSFNGWEKVRGIMLIYVAYFAGIMKVFVHVIRVGLSEWLSEGVCVRACRQFETSVTAPLGNQSSIYVVFSSRKTSLPVLGRTVTLSFAGSVCVDRAGVWTERFLREFCAWPQSQIKTQAPPRPD